MMSKNNLFKLDVSGIEFWQKVQEDENVNYEENYIKQVCSEGTIFLDRMGKPKGMPKTDGCYYMDLVTGRAVSLCLSDDGESYVIIPTMVVVPKDRLRQVGRELYAEAADILNDDEKTKAYTKVSEEVLYDGHFCDLIANRSGLEKIPAELVEQEIDMVKKSFSNKSLTKSFVKVNQISE